jgi:hypothetical protein
MMKMGNSKCNFFANITYSITRKVSSDIQLYQYTSQLVRHFYNSLADSSVSTNWSNSAKKIMRVCIYLNIKLSITIKPELTSNYESL